MRAGHGHPARSLPRAQPTVPPEYDGPMVERRYLPLGDEDDLMAHRTEVCWPIQG